MAVAPPQGQGRKEVAPEKEEKEKEIEVLTIDSE